jgi:hypothetical protein
MVDDFAKRVRSAAISAWWTVLIAVIFVTVLWVAYLLLLSCRPSWFLSLCGPDMTWPTVQSVSINAIAHLKLVIWVMALLSVWLSLWSRRLRRG